MSEERILLVSPDGEDVNGCNFIDWHPDNAIARTLFQDCIEGEYIRADVAKEREEKLICAAINNTTERFRPDLDSIYQLGDVDDAYHEAGLERLK